VKTNSSLESRNQEKLWPDGLLRLVWWNFLKISSPLSSSYQIHALLGETNLLLWTSVRFLSSFKFLGSSCRYMENLARWDILSHRSPPDSGQMTNFLCLIGSLMLSSTGAVWWSKSSNYCFHRLLWNSKGIGINRLLINDTGATQAIVYFLWAKMFTKNPQICRVWQLFYPC